jgi:hypothetical protein
MVYSNSKNAIDDATSAIYYAQLAEEETTAAVMAGLRAVIEQKGLFCALYSGRGAHFWLTLVITQKRPLMISSKPATLRG